MSNFMVMAGGTGGHIFPALAVAQKLRAAGHEVIWLGSTDSMEARLVPGYGFHLETLPIKGVRGNGLRRKLCLPFTLCRTVFMTYRLLKRFNIKGVIGFGGFVSFPGGVAAYCRRLPLIIHEQNAKAGLANKVLAKIATATYFAFPQVFPDPEGEIGNPIRPEIENLPPPAVRFASRSGPLKMLVVGGSLGARVFNERLPRVLSLIAPEHRPEVYHQCGKDNSSAVAALYRDLGVNARVVDFIDPIAGAYATADFIVCRAGALTVFELAAAGLGGFLIPFPFAADDHQSANAGYLVRGGAAVCCPQAELNEARFARQIAGLSRADCRQWANNARALAKYNAAATLAVRLQKLNNG